MRSNKFNKMIAVSCVVSVFISGCSTMTAKQTKDYFANLYKRIEYKQDGDYRVIDIFYATSRKVEERADSEPKFLPEMGKETTGGLIDVKINPNIRIGKMLPKRFQRKGEMGIQSVKPFSEDVLIENLKKAVKTSPHKSIMVLVMGFKDDFSSVAIEAAYSAYMLDVNTPVLLFDWPGDQSVSIGGYKRAQKYAMESGPYMGKLLARIIREVKPEKIWIQSASLGCQVVCDAFEYMYDHADLADPQSEIAHVFMAAPDVAEGEFDMEFKNQIAALSDGLTTYVASNDGALLISGFLNDDRRLGLQYLRDEQDQSAEARAILYLKSQQPDKIAMIDVTPINKASYGHGYYLEDPQYFDDVFIRLFTKRPYANRRVYLVKQEDGTDYWILK